MSVKGRPTGPKPRTQAILEDAEWMADTGESYPNAAARLGMTEQALEKTLLRHRRDVDLRLRRNTPEDANRYRTHKGGRLSV